MTSNPQITRDLLEHVSSQLAPDAMHPFAPAEPTPPKWPSDDHWARFAALTDYERAEMLRSAFTESATAVYIQQMINTTQISGLHNTAFYFVQDHLFELVHSRNEAKSSEQLQDASASKATTKKNKAKKAKQDKDKERDKLLTIYKTRRYEWPQDDPAAAWLLSNVIFPARNGVDVCEFTCGSVVYQDPRMFKEVITTLALQECKSFDVMRTAPQEVRRVRAGHAAGGTAPVIKVATVMAISVAGFLAMRLATFVHDFCVDASLPVAETGKCLSIYSGLSNQASTFSSAFLQRHWRDLPLADRIQLLQRVFPETSHPTRRAKAAFVEALTHNPAVNLSVPSPEQNTSGFPQLLASIAAVEDLGGFLCEFVCYVRLIEYHADGWCKWAEESTSILQDLWMQPNATELLADRALDAAVNSGLSQPSRPKKKKKKKPKRKATSTSVANLQQTKPNSPAGSDSDNDSDNEGDEDNGVHEKSGTTVPAGADVVTSSEVEQPRVPEVQLPSTDGSPPSIHSSSSHDKHDDSAASIMTQTSGEDPAPQQSVDLMAEDVAQIDHQIQRSDTEEVLDAAVSARTPSELMLEELDVKIEPITFEEEAAEDDAQQHQEHAPESANEFGADPGLIEVADDAVDSLIEGSFESPRSMDPQPSVSRAGSPLLTRGRSSSGQLQQLSALEDVKTDDVLSTDAVYNPLASPVRSNARVEDSDMETVSDPDEGRDTFDTQDRGSEPFGVLQQRKSNPAAFQQILLRRMGSESSITSSEETRSPPPSMRLSSRGAQLLRAAIPGAAAAAARRRGQPQLISESLLKGQLMNNTEHMTSNDGSIDLIATAKFQELCDRLSDDIDDMARNLTRIAVIRRPWQLAAIERVRAIITSLWPHSAVEVYGSFTTGLAIPASDVDLVVCGMHEMLQWWGGKAMSAVSILADALRGAEWVSTVQAVEQTAVPVVKVSIAPVPTSFGDRRGIIRMDISFDVNTGSAVHGQQHQTHTHGHVHGPVHQGLQARDFTLRLCAMNPLLTPLVLVLKQYLLENGLHDAYMGGLPSHALTVMVASMLQRHTLEPPEQQPDLGTLLLAFFQLFGTAFDTRKHMVCLSPMGPLVTLSPLHSPHVPRVGTPEWWRPADPVVIQDPLQPNNNIGRACFGFRQLQLHFDKALQNLMKFGEESNGNYDSDFSALGALFSTAHHRNVVQLTAQVWCPREQMPQPILQKQASTTGDEERTQRCIEMIKTLSHDELKRFEKLLQEATSESTATAGEEQKA